MDTGRTKRTEKIGNTVYTCDPQTGAFKKKGELEISFAGSGYTQFKNKFYIIGGKFGAGNPGFLYEITPESLDTTIRYNKVGALIGTALSADNSFLYLFAGQNETGSLSDNLWKISIGSQQ